MFSQSHATKPGVILFTYNYLRSLPGFDLRPSFVRALSLEAKKLICVECCQCMDKMHRFNPIAQG